MLVTEPRESCEHGVSFDEVCDGCTNALASNPTKASDPVDELQRMFEASAGPSSVPGDTVSLLDEDDPDCQTVAFRRPNGQVFMTMPLEVYKHFREKGRG